MVLLAIYLPPEFQKLKAMIFKLILTIIVLSVTTNSVHAVGKLPD